LLNQDLGRRQCELELKLREHTHIHTLPLSPDESRPLSPSEGGILD
jgi:hypothetical protein